jgi:probable phosphoglycerate mutase
MAHWLLTRHGHVPGIEPARFRGRAPLELTQRGRTEATRLAKRVAEAWRPVIVYSSPMARCIATAKPVAERCGVHVEVLEALNDLDYGQWQGKTHVEVAEHSPHLYRQWLETPDLVRFPGGESLQDLAVRVADALRFCIERHAEQDLLVVAHDSFNRVLLMQALRLPLAAYRSITQAPCALSELSYDGGQLAVTRLNETGHLEQ